MNALCAPFFGGCLLAALAATATEPVAIHSPGLPASSLDGQGRLVEDWAALDVQLVGEGLEAGETEVTATRLDDTIPAAQAVTDYGAVRQTCTAYRAPVFPAGVDVLTVRLDELRGQATRVTLQLALPAGTRLGERVVRSGGRTLVTLPDAMRAAQQLLAWGHADEATALPGWAKPQGSCDPAFRNIRGGMGGVPIRYRFTVEPGGSASVVLGFCESHWDEPARRPVTCYVEGADPQTVDPVARWGQHQPGVLPFEARDENSDGRLEIAIRPVPGAEDRNPILNVLWLFPPGASPPLDELLAGQWSASATHYVDVGGANDQSIFPRGQIEYTVALPAGESRELTFLVACPGGSTPLPETSSWTPASLRRAAREVWRDWHE